MAPDFPPELKFDKKEGWYGLTAEGEHLPADLPDGLARPPYPSQAQALPRRRHRHQGLEGPEPAVPGVGSHREAPRREGHHPRAQEPRQEGRRHRHRHRLRPRGRAHRLGRPAPDAPGGARHARQPRALLRLHQGRDRPRLLQPRRARPGPRRRRREPPVHRPHLGRRAHALPHHGPLRRLRQRALRRPRADAHAGARGRARARAPWLRARGLLGALRRARQGRRPLQDPRTPRPASRTWPPRRPPSRTWSMPRRRV